MARSTLKHAVSRTVARLGVPGALIRRNGHPTILYYHRVVEEWDPTLELAVSIEAFEAQVAHLTEKWNVVSLDEVEAHWRNGVPLRARSVAITFDDGYEDNYGCAFPILKRYGAPAAMFLTAAYVGTDGVFWWDRASALSRKAIAGGSLRGVDPAQWVARLRELDEAARRAALDDLEARVGPVDREALPRSLRWEEVREMADSGIIMGSHTRTHPDLTRLAPGDVEREVQVSKGEIEAHLGKAVRFFSYPFGGANPDAQMAVARAGYAVAFAGQNARPSPFSVPRRKVKESHTWGPGRRFSPALFEAEVSGVLDRIFLRGSR